MILVVKERWPELGYMPDRRTQSPQSEQGYHSVAELRETLKQRWPKKRVRNIPNGVTFTEQFNAFGESASRVFEATLESVTSEQKGTSPTR